MVEDYMLNAGSPNIYWMLAFQTCWQSKYCMLNAGSPNIIMLIAGSPNIICWLLAVQTLNVACWQSQHILLISNSLNIFCLMLMAVRNWSCACHAVCYPALAMMYEAGTAHDCWLRSLTSWRHHGLELTNGSTEKGWN